MANQISRAAGIGLIKKRIGEIADFERDAGDCGVVAVAEQGDPLYLRCEHLDHDIRETIQLVFGAESAEARFYCRDLPNLVKRYEAYIRSAENVENDLTRKLFSALYRARPPLSDFFGGQLTSAKAKLNHALKRLEETMNLDGTLETPPDIRRSDRNVSENSAPRAFVVHGHDEAAREAVARYLQQIDFDPVILHERANMGQTVIEKFESNADVKFAVILLTPDDVGGTDATHLAARARQNVILEFGYFIGRLGRKRVMALRKGEIEMPSDILGVVAQIMDDHGAWKQRLAKELESAGYAIDWKKARI